jgi:hypothetical protein
MSGKMVVLAIFGSGASAGAAVVALKDSGLVPADAIGVLVPGGGGQLKVGKVGARSTGEGAGIGAVLFLLGPAGAGIGMAGGSILGFAPSSRWGRPHCVKIWRRCGRAGVGCRVVFRAADSAPVGARGGQDGGGLPVTSANRGTRAR